MSEELRIWVEVAFNVTYLIVIWGLAYLVLRDSLKTGDATFKWIGISILISYACYIPVIFFVQQVPMIGMLMIPKTLAYVAIGFLAYNDFYRPRSSRAAKAFEAASKA